MCHHLSPVAVLSSVRRTTGMPAIYLMAAFLVKIHSPVSSQPGWAPPLPAPLGPLSNTEAQTSSCQFSTDIDIYWHFILFEDSLHQQSSDKTLPNPLPSLCPLLFPASMRDFLNLPLLVRVDSHSLTPLPGSFLPTAILIVSVSPLETVCACPPLYLPLAHAFGAKISQTSSSTASAEIFSHLKVYIVFLFNPKYASKLHLKIHSCNTPVLFFTSAVRKDLKSNVPQLWCWIAEKREAGCWTLPSKSHAQPTL